MTTSTAKPKAAPNHLVQVKQYGALLTADSKLTRTARAVGIVLANLYNEREGYAFPSLDYLAEHIGAPIASVKRAIVDLEEKGYLTHKRGSGRHRSNEYKPAFERGAELSRRHQPTQSLLQHSRGPSGITAKHGKNKSATALIMGRYKRICAAKAARACNETPMFSHATPWDPWGSQSSLTQSERPVRPLE
jgi:DNA-binding MarR family transcriptional regulator